MSIENISLYNSDTSAIIEVTVSKEDAARARNDVAFATQLMNTALENQSHMVKDSIQINSATENETIIDTDADDPNEVGEVETSQYRWSVPCVLLLLETFKAMENKFNNGKYSKKKLWQEIAKLLNTKQYVVNGLQCAAKMRSLKKTYKAIKDHNNKSGNDRRTWQFFEAHKAIMNTTIMDEIFCTKAWCNPTSVASSTGLSIQQQEKDKSTVESESECSCNPSTSKVSVKSLLAKRLRQKDIVEENKTKRHKERMDMDQKLLEALEKLSKK